MKNEKIDWEKRIRQNKIRRKREQRKHLFQFLFAVCFICVAVMTFSVIHSNASEADQQVSIKYYKNILIESGDTLASIADTYADEEHYSSKQKYIDEVMLMNHIEDENQIYAGTKIFVPYYSDEYK